VNSASLGDGEEALAHIRAASWRRLPTLSHVRRTRAFFRRVIRAVRISATDTRIPRPLRWLAALGLAPIPGPLDEALLIIVVVPLVAFYREPLVDAWRRAVA
jgi:hypothetical protein